MAMTKTEVLALLKENRNERGIEHWKKKGGKPSKLKSYGIGLTQLRKIAKQVGRDHKLAQSLWKSNFYDAKVVGLLIDDPKQFTKEQAEAQVALIEEQLRRVQITAPFDGIVVSGDLSQWHSGALYTVTDSVTDNPDGTTQTVVERMVARWPIRRANSCACGWRRNERHRDVS